MKIRIRGNSVRLRLTQSEVKILSETGIMTETTCFGPAPDQTLQYTLKAEEGIDTLMARLEGQHVTVLMPAQEARAWFTAERIGYEHIQEVAPGVGLFLLVEKDFVCLDNTFEDQSDNYPNPNAEC